MKNEKTKVGVLLGVLLVAIVMTVGVTFALWQVTLQQESTNTITTGCFLLELKDKTEAINLEKAYPITDEVGKSLKSYDFTITNRCAGTSAYSINLETLVEENESDRLENLNFMKMMINLEGEEGTPVLLTSNDVKDPTLIEGTDIADKAFEIATGVLDGKTDENDAPSVTYQLRLWMGEETPADDAFMNKVLRSKITVVGSLANNPTTPTAPEETDTP